EDAEYQRCDEQLAVDVLPEPERNRCTNAKRKCSDRQIDRMANSEMRRAAECRSRRERRRRNHDQPDSHGGKPEHDQLIVPMAAHARSSATAAANWRPRSSKFLNMSKLAQAGDSSTRSPSRATDLAYRTASRSVS